MNNLQLNNIKERLIFISPTVQGKIERELTLKDFQNLGPLGQGAFGKVYQVKSRINNQVYALKQIQKQQIKKQDMVSQITNEVKLMYSIDHPNIIKLYNHFEEEDYIYLVLEYASGGQLWKILNKIGRFDENTVKKILRDIISAVEYLHSKNPPIIHRDIKPENLILDGQKKVKVADFGWSNVFNDTKRKTYCGTLEYLAPEMIQEQGHDVSLDLWSLGVLIFELLSGKAPFTPDTNIPLDQRQKKLKQNILNLSLEFPIDFPILAKDLVTRLLQQNPKQRITIKQMKQHSWFTQNNEQQNFFQIQQNQESIDYSQIKEKELKEVAQGEFTKQNIVQIHNRINRDSIQNTNNSNNESMSTDVDVSNINEENKNTIVQQLNQKCAKLIRNLNESKIEIEIQNKKIGSLQEEIEKYEQNGVNNNNNYRKIQVLEDEKKLLKQDYNDMWEENKKKDEVIRNLKYKLDQLNDFEQTISKNKQEIEQLKAKNQKLQNEYDSLENKFSETKAAKDKEILKLEMKITVLEMDGITDRNSQRGGSFDVKNLHQLIQDLNQKFQNTVEIIEAYEKDIDQQKEMERELIKLRAEQNNNKQDIEMRIQEKMEDQIDEIKQSFRLEKQELINKFEQKLNDLEKERNDYRKQILEQNLQQMEYESLKTQVGVQNDTIKNIRQEQEENIKLRVILEEQVKHKDLIIKDLEQYIKKNSKSK